MKRLLGIPLAAGVLLATPALSEASRAPTAAQRKAILQAGPGNPYPPGWAHLKVRVSTVDSRWAAIYILANPGHKNQVQPDVASVFHSKHRGWVDHQNGNGGGCGVPSQVKRDLSLACY